VCINGAVAATCGEYEGCVVGVAAVECGISSEDAGGKYILFWSPKYSNLIKTPRLPNSEGFFVHCGRFAGGRVEGERGKMEKG
jgi:hypothetical protein